MDEGAPNDNTSRNDNVTYKFYDIFVYVKIIFLVLPIFVCLFKHTYLNSLVPQSVLAVATAADEQSAVALT